MRMNSRDRCEADQTAEDRLRNGLKNLHDQAAFDKRGPA